MQTAILVAPKAGAQTVMAAIYSRFVGGRPERPTDVKFEHGEICEPLTAPAVAEMDVARVAFIRHPLVRFASLWRNKVRDRTSGIPSCLYGASPAELMIYIRNHPDENGHWIRQSTLLGGVEAEVLRIEAFADWWGEPVEIRNRTRGDIACDARGVLEHYAEDLALWERA